MEPEVGQFALKHQIEYARGVNQPQHAVEEREVLGDLARVILYQLD